MNGGSGSDDAHPSARLPEGARPVRKLGPFDAAGLPRGLLRRHCLGADSWAVLQVHAGSVWMVWEEAPGRRTLLEQGQSLVIPPNAPHHLEPRDAVTLSLEIYSAAG